MLSREEQIEEMANVIKLSLVSLGSGNFNFTGEEISTMFAEALYNADYRKQSEGLWAIVEYEYFTCSKCGYYHPNGCDTTKEAKEKLAEGIYPQYCADCGAKMTAKKYFTPEEVRKMSRSEVRDNYTAIIDSINKWGCE